MAEVRSAVTGRDCRMEEQAYANRILIERPGPLRRRRQMKWVREFEAKDVADDAAEAFRWGFTADGREPEDSGREQ